MGDFDRVQQPGSAPKNETKKIAMVVLLGAVLLGMLGYNMIKKGPGQAAAAQPANESGGGGNGAVTVIDQPTDVLRAALAQDPAATLLKNPDANQFPTTTLRNPFRMSVAMYDSIKPKAVEVAPAPTPNPTPGPTPNVLPTPTPTGTPAVKTLVAGAYKINTIIVSNGHLSALINGRLVSAGGVVGDALVLEVRDNGVTLRHKDFPDGPTMDIRIH